MKNAAKCDFARYGSYPYSRKRASESSSGDEQNSSQRRISPPEEAAADRAGADQARGPAATSARRMSFEEAQMAAHVSDHVVTTFGEPDATAQETAEEADEEKKAVAAGTPMMGASLSC